MGTITTGRASGVTLAPTQEVFTGDSKPETTDSNANVTSPTIAETVAVDNRKLLSPVKPGSLNRGHCRADCLWIDISFCNSREGCIV